MFAARRFAKRSLFPDRRFPSKQRPARGVLHFALLRFEALEERCLLSVTFQTPHIFAGSDGFVATSSLSAMLPGFNSNTLAANDDSSTGQVDLPFTINFFGTGFNHLWVNNNGNVTFNGPLDKFTPFGLTSNIGTPIIAPFFADVDTTGSLSGLVTYGTGTVDGHLAFGVNYPNVGYYNSHTDKLNSFQLILIDRPDRGSGPSGDDFDIEFNYDGIQWETGDASSGSSGLGGSSARVGFSNGTGAANSFFELPGSGVNGAFLDSNPSTGLIHNDKGSNVPGRYNFAVHNGRVNPIVTPPSDQTGTATLSHSFDLGSFSDSSGSACTVEINWGDGTPDTVFQALPGPLEIGAHTYARAGNDNVTITVTNNSGSSGSATFNVLVTILGDDPTPPTPPVPRPIAPPTPPPPLVPIAFSVPSPAPVVPVVILPPVVGAGGYVPPPIVQYRADSSVLRAEAFNDLFGAASHLERGQEEVALLTYLADADQPHLLGIELGDELQSPSKPTNSGRTERNKPVDELAVAQQEEVAADAGFNYWWLLAAPPGLLGAKVAWNYVRKANPRRHRWHGNQLG